MQRCRAPAAPLKVQSPIVAQIYEKVRPRRLTGVAFVCQRIVAYHGIRLCGDRRL